MTVEELATTKGQLEPGARITVFGVLTLAEYCPATPCPPGAACAACGSTFLIAPASGAGRSLTVAFVGGLKQEELSLVVGNKYVMTGTLVRWALDDGDNLATLTFLTSRLKP